MANTGNSDKWYFTKEQLENTPSRKCGFDAYKELQYRQQAANFIQDMGQRLQVSQLCINTAIVYMHRFYVFHSFTNFPWHQMAAAALFLAAKVEEQPRKLEYVIRVANICKNPKDRSFDINSERYIAQSQDLVFNENVLLQTLGFDVAIDHPHTYVVRCCHLVRASKDLAQTSYFMASNSLHLTTMCIQYKPTVVACFCILLACKWSNWEIPLSNEKKEWYTYVDPTVTAELLQQLTSEFLVIFENCPSRLKEKIMAKQESSNSPFEQERKPDNSSLRSLEYKGDDPHKHRGSRPPEAASSSHRSQEQREREYKERKEKERIAHMSGINLAHQSHHHRSERPPTDPTKIKQHSRPPSSGPSFPPSRNEPRDILREAVKDSPFGIPAIRDPAREHVKDPYAARSDKEVPKRDPLLKSNVQTDPNSLTNLSDVRQQRVDPSRSRMDSSKSASKQDMVRRYEDPKLPHIKTETDNIKKHLSSSFDKNNAYIKSSSSSTSQKVKSPFNLDSKSVPKTNSNQANVPHKTQFNGSTNGSYSKSSMPLDVDVKIKTEPHPIKEEIPTPQVIKRPSLFSPEQTPQHQQIPIKTEPLSKAPSLTSLSALSPINSPPSVPSMRNRNYSSSSEPELRPTMKKIDQVEGFENLMRDNTIGMNHMQNSDSRAMQQEQEMLKSEIKSENFSPIKETMAGSQSVIVNGLETNPTLISNLLKEVAATSHLPGVATTSIKQEPIESIQSAASVPPPENSEKEHRHHKSKKKKEKHKHRDKDKSKEDKEKKKKHKDKDRERHKHRERKEQPEPPPMISEPIKITIQKDRIQKLNQLKIKIPKDKIKTEGIVDSLPLPQPSSGGLKIKIPKDIIANCGSSSSLSSLDMSLSCSSSNRKRDRERTSSSTEVPPLKISRSSHKESKQNGRHSYSKVSNKPPSSRDSFASSDQVNSSISENIVREKQPSIELITSNDAQIEENNNNGFVKDVPEENSSALMKLPSTPKDVSSTVDMVSPTLLSPISASDSFLGSLEAPLHLSPMPLSPISPSNTPPLDEDVIDAGDVFPMSFNEDTFKNVNDILKDNIANNTLNEIVSTTPTGLTLNIHRPSDIHVHPNDKSSKKYPSNSPPYPQGAINPPRVKIDPPSMYKQAQITNTKPEMQNPPPYNSTPYKFVNNSMYHNAPYKGRHSVPFQRQNRHYNNKYDHTPYNHPPPYPHKGPRGPRNMNPRHPPPQYSSRMPPTHIADVPLGNTYSQIPQNHENPMHYASQMPQMSYNAYQVAPPTMPNVNVPPPTYGLYSMYGGYMYPEMFQQQMEAFGGGVAQPPLPTDAPPASEVPPPPPPEG